MNTGFVMVLLVVWVVVVVWSLWKTVMYLFLKDPDVVARDPRTGRAKALSLSQCLCPTRRTRARVLALSRSQRKRAAVRCGLLGLAVFVAGAALMVVAAGVGVPGLHAV